MLLLACYLLIKLYNVYSLDTYELLAGSWYLLLQQKHVSLFHQLRSVSNFWTNFRWSHKQTLPKNTSDAISIQIRLK